jgi:hypothetical protein
MQAQQLWNAACDAPRMVTSTNHAYEDGETTRRWSWRRKWYLVQQLWAGAPVYQVAHEHGVMVYELLLWHQLATAALEHVHGGSGPLLEAVAERAVETFVVRLQNDIRALQARSRPRPAEPSLQEVDRVSELVSPGVGRRYGVRRVCLMWGVARATYYRHRGRQGCGQPGATATQVPTTEELRRLCAASELFTGVLAPSAGDPAELVRWQALHWLARARSIAQVSSSTGLPVDAVASCLRALLTALPQALRISTRLARAGALRQALCETLMRAELALAWQERGRHAAPAPVRAPVPALAAGVPLLAALASSAQLGRAR